MASVDPSLVYDDTLAAGSGPAPRRIGGSLAAGQIVGERYRVGRLLGSGGMGLVFEGTHIELGSPVAIKIVRPQFSQDSHILERFVNEARNVAALTSPHVARVFDAGKLNTGEAYLVMERLVGQDLATLLKQSGPLPWPLAVSYVGQACEGLAEAHAHGIVHRDLKPEHLFIVQNGAAQPLVKILDFGIAKNIRQGEARMTLPGDSIGSPLYMSPEQVQNPALVDERTDVWSLGIVLYEALTGRLPFNGETVAQVQWQVVAEEPEPLSARCPDAPPALDSILLRCLRKSPMERFESMHALRAALYDLLESAGQRSSAPALVAPPVVAPVVALPVVAPPVVARPIVAPPIAESPLAGQPSLSEPPAPSDPRFGAPDGLTAPPTSVGLSDDRALDRSDTPTFDELRAAGVPKSHGFTSALFMAGGLLIALVALGSVSLGGFDNVKAWSQGLDATEHPSRFEEGTSAWTPPLVLPILRTQPVPAASVLGTPAPDPAATPPADTVVSPASPPATPPAATATPPTTVQAPPTTVQAPGEASTPNVPRRAPSEADKPRLSPEEAEARYRQWLKQENLVPVDEVTIDEALSHPKSP